MSRVIVRHCRPEHNLIRTNTIRLGTLRYYRHIEDDARRDTGEGTFLYDVRFPEPIEVDGQWFQSISAPVADLNDPFSLSMYAKRIAVAEASVGGKLLVDGCFTTAVDFFNCYILCASVYERCAEIDGLFKDAPDYWYLLESNAEHFGKTVADALRRKIHYNLIKDPDFWPIRMVPRDAQFNVACRFRSVAYEDREIVVRKQSDMDVSTLRIKYSDSPFIKPRRHMNEKEFRFSFTVLANGRPVPVIDEPISIDIEEIPQYVRAK